MKLIQDIVHELSRDGFNEMLESVAPQKESKSRTLLEILRTQKLSDKEIQEKLDLTPGAYYTLKSRLLPKLVHYYTHRNENTIRLLREEAARVSFVVLNNDRTISLTFLKDLEKKLVAYDMSAELAIVYKQLARLHRFDEQFDTYEKAYQKHIGFSLAVSKAEDLLYEYIYHLGYYHLTHNGGYRQKLDDLLDELESTFNLYESHRLYTLFHIVQHYHRCAFLDSETLKTLEIEVEGIMDQLEAYFERYGLDPFYGVIRNLLPFLNFEYYVHIGNRVKANHYLGEIVTLIEEQFRAHLWSFFISQFLLSLMEKLKTDGELDSFLKPADRFRSGYFIEQNESSHMVIFFRYRSMVAFYRGDYARAALEINNLRNISNFKSLPLIEIELKLFQAFMYTLLDETELYLKLVASAKRQAQIDEETRCSVKSFSKILFLLHKNHTRKISESNLEKYWNHFNSPEGNPTGLFNHLKLDMELLYNLLGK